MLPASRKGFTLVELLVVVAIILTLAAILFPVFTSAKRNAERSVCATQMREIAVAIQNYAGDNSGKVPPGQFYYGPPPYDKGFSYQSPLAWPPEGVTRMMDEEKRRYPTLWHGRLRRYLKSTRILICPATTRSMVGQFYRPTVPNTPADFEYPYTTYGLNWRFSNGSNLVGDCRAISASASRFIGEVQTLESPPAPSRTVLLIETQQSLKLARGSDEATYAEPGGNVMPFGDWGPYFWAIRWLDYPWTPSGHGGGCNIVLADGHVKFVQAPSPPYPPSASHIEDLGYRWW